MAFVKVENDNYIIGVGQNQATTGGISKTEYDQISTQINNKPDNPPDRIYKLRADTLEWELVELPPIEPEPMTDEDALVRYANELTGASNQDLISAAETLIEQKIKEE